VTDCMIRSRSTSRAYRTSDSSNNHLLQSRTWKECRVKLGVALRE
jgi:hypothetical protein